MNKSVSQKNELKAPLLLDEINFYASNNFVEPENKNQEIALNYSINVDEKPQENLLFSSKAKSKSGFLLTSKMIDKTLNDGTLASIVKSYLKKSEITSSDLYNLIETGAKFNGFYLIKPVMIKSLADQLEGELGVNTILSEKRRATRNRLIKIFHKVLQTQKKANLNKSKNPQPFRKFTSAVVQSPIVIKKDLLSMRKIFFKYFLVMSLLGIIVFIGFWLVFQFGRAKIYDYIGFQLGIARGGAFSAVIFTLLCLLFMYRNVITYLRKRLFGKLCNILLNEHIEVHKICGCFILFFGLVHTIGHLTGTLWVMSSETDLNRLNSILTHKRFDRIYSYAELLFATIPGLTGVLMIIILGLMLVTSFDFIKKKYFEVFSYTHMMYVAFVALLYIHGCDFWFNDGWPVSLPAVTGSFLIAIYHHVRKWYQKNLGFEILDVSFSAKNSVAYLKIKKPAGFNILPGQYLFLNVPELSWFQWHPFSICSTGRDGALKLMIKDAGDFTKTFLALVFKAKSDYIVNKRPEVAIRNNFFKIYHDFLLNSNTLMRKNSGNDKAQKEETKPKKPEEKPLFPKIGIYGPITAPAEDSLYKKNVTYIGAGVGIAPFLIFLDEYISYLKRYRRESTKVNIEKEFKNFLQGREALVTSGPMNSKVFNGMPAAQDNILGAQIPDRDLRLVDEFYKNIESMSFYYVARDLDQLSWISGYVQKLFKYNHAVEKLDLKLFLTTSKDVGSLESFLFWRAFNFYQKSKKKGFKGFSNELLIDLPVEIIFGRPNFELLFREKTTKSTKDYSVYACAPNALLNAVSEACIKISKETSSNFNFFPEKFG